MEPLFAAIVHGCAAEIHQIALEEVYYLRIRREGDDYLTKKLGAFGAELSVLFYFFTTHWHTPAAGLTDSWKASVLNFTAFRLWALGRLQEAVLPMQSCLKMFVEQEKWIGAASSAGSLNQLQLAQGNVSLAIKVAIHSLELTDKSGDDFEDICNRTNFANAQHQAGDLKSAHVSFEKAESLQKQRQEEYPQLYALHGFQYCDLLLTVGEWRDVQKRAKQSLEWVNEEKETALQIKYRY